MLVREAIWHIGSLYDFEGLTNVRIFFLMAFLKRFSYQKTSETPWNFGIPAHKGVTEVLAASAVAGRMQSAVETGERERVSSSQLRAQGLSLCLLTASHALSHLALVNKFYFESRKSPVTFESQCTNTISYSVECWKSGEKSHQNIQNRKRTVTGDKSNPQHRQQAERN